MTVVMVHSFWTHRCKRFTSSGIVLKGNLLVYSLTELILAFCSHICELQQPQFISTSQYSTSFVPFLGCTQPENCVWMFIPYIACGYDDIIFTNSP